MPDNPTLDLHTALAARFSDAPEPDAAHRGDAALNRMAARGSCRQFRDTPVPPEWITTLCALALASPSKSDLQQRDIIVLQSPDVRQSLAALVPSQPWIAQAPMLAVFCGNNRRQRLLHHWRDVPFANDHLDAFFNATGDAAIALGAFVTAAEAMGLGCCPISGIRNEAADVSTLLGLPDYVFPFAGLAFGFPAAPPEISPRLPLAMTCHMDRYQETDLKYLISDYDAKRAERQPYANQRRPDDFAKVEPYTWSEDKVRQYSREERETFGNYIRDIGFLLD